MNRVLAIAAKDIRQIFRNRFMAVITFLSIVFFAIIYYLLPAQVDESLELGLHLEKGRSALEKALEEEGEEGLVITWADSRADVRRLVKNKDVQAGFSITFPDTKARVTLFTSSETPDEIREAGSVIGRELGFTLSGRPLPLEINEIFIGPDMLGQQVPLRNQLRILFLMAILLVEVYALANLLADELRLGTVKALLVTPVSPGEFMEAKSVTGVSLAFSESIIGALLLQIMSSETWLVVTMFLFLGSLLVTGIAFMIGAVAKEMIGVIGWATAAYLILVIPGMTVVFPGIASPIISVVPTDPLITAIDGIVNQGLSPTLFISEAVILGAYALFFFLLGYFLLRRRLA